MKNYYSDYVSHMVRLYLRVSQLPNPVAELRTDADKLDYLACEAVIKTMTTEEVELIKLLYSGDSLDSSIVGLHERTGVRKNTLWAKVKKYETLIAMSRGIR